MRTPFCHGTFTIRRTWAVTPSRVFNAWSDPAVKAEWFTGPPERWTLSRRSIDFRVGGTEILEGLFTDSGKTSLFEARYHVIEPNQRLVYVYDLHHSDSFHSVTMASLTLEPESGGTRVAYTEQIVFLDGRDGTADRQHGSELMFVGIEKAIGLEGAAQ